jgi:hypothetical protein
MQNSIAFANLDAIIEKKRLLWMINDQANQNGEWEIEIAKRIACAVVSYQVGVQYEELWDQYADQGEEVGTYWLSLAKQIAEAFPNRPKG